jgi:2-(1,2-epoxy-1,2-dihydrophenyl)acetyl-CoA isomerase
MGNIEYSVTKKVARITLDKPPANLFDKDMGERLYELLQNAEGNQDVSAIYITGKGKRFSGGLDLSTVDPSDTQYIEQLQHGVFNPIITQLYNSRKAVICAMNGSAAGVGLMIGLVSDLTYLKQGARMAFTFADRGLVPACGATHILPKLVGEKRALEIILMREKISAEQAVKEGLINGVYGNEQEILEKVKHIAELSPELIALTKRAMKDRTETELITRLLIEEKVQSEAFRLPSFQNGIAKFRK